MSFGHIAIYLVILLLLALPVVGAFLLIRWLVRRSRT